MCLRTQTHVQPFSHNSSYWCPYTKGTGHLCTMQKGEILLGDTQANHHCALSVMSCQCNHTCKWRKHGGPWHFWVNISLCYQWPNTHYLPCRIWALWSSPKRNCSSNATPYKGWVKYWPNNYIIFPRWISMCGEAPMERYRNWNSTKLGHTTICRVFEPTYYLFWLFSGTDRDSNTLFTMLWQPSAKPPVWSTATVTNLQLGVPINNCKFPCSNQL